MSKRNRIENAKLCDLTRRIPCEACGKRNRIECHHIITRARLGPDLPFNLMALCGGPQGCHRLWHDKPLSEFFVLFPKILPNLEKRGFEWIEAGDYKRLISPPEDKWNDL